MRGKVAKLIRAKARQEAYAKDTSLRWARHKKGTDVSRNRNSGLVLTYSEGSYRSIYLNLKKFYKREKRLPSVEFSTWTK